MKTRPKLKVLVVEDEFLIQMMISDVLVELGHEVIAVAGAAADALVQIRLNRPDLVLLDVNLGGQLSYEVANHCTVEGIPVILTTGYSPAELPKGLAHCPVLNKPFSSEDLSEILSVFTRAAPSGGEGELDGPALGRGGTISERG